MARLFRRIALAFAVTLPTLALTTITPRPAGAAVALPTGFVDEQLAIGLAEANSFAFLPDGRILITEQRTGNIRLMLANNTLVSSPAYTVEGVNSSGNERGLQGIAVDPRWPSPAYAYVMFNRTGTREWIVRVRATGDLTNPTSGNLSFTEPLILINTIRDAASNHNAGTLRFGNDGHLYATVGEDAVPCASQSVDSLLGKLLRMDVTRLPAGGGGPVPKALLIPADNPLSGADSNARLVYATGLRNPWRMHVDPATGTVYVADVGEGATEEVNEIVAGRNYGWPFREGNTVRTVGGCTEPGGPGGTSYAAPILTLSHSQGYLAIQSATVYRPVANGTANWPMSYWGSLFVGDYYDSGLRRYVKNGATWSAAPAVPGQPSSAEWSGGMLFAVDFHVGPDGSLYWLKAGNDAFSPNTGSVRRIRWTGTPAAVDPRATVASGLTGAPNPFTRHVELSGLFPSGTLVTTTVFDALGRRVRASTAREREPGRFAWTWDGLDEDGAETRPGIYLVRFSSGGLAHTTRVLRVR